MPDGEQIDTESVGAHTFTVSASDTYGNGSSSTARYRVIYDFRGFLWPVRDRPSVNRGAGGPPGARALLAERLSRAARVLAAGYPQVAEIGVRTGAEPQAGERARVRRAHWGRGYGYRVEDTTARGPEAVASCSSGWPTGLCIAPTTASRASDTR